MEYLSQSYSAPLALHQSRKICICQAGDLNIERMSIQLHVTVRFTLLSQAHGAQERCKYSEGCKNNMRKNPKALERQHVALCYQNVQPSDDMHQTI